MRPTSAMDGVTSGTTDDPRRATVATTADVRVVLVTIDAPEAALAMGRTLVGERLAACVNVVPSIASIYRWKGKVCEDPEALMVIKTTRKRLDALTQRIAQLHTYASPEVLAIDPCEGIAPYVDWLREETA